MKLLFILAWLLPLSIQAAPSESLESFTCTSTEGFEVVGQKQECLDERYQSWQRNGCYEVTITKDSYVLFEEEMVRNIPFYLELRQKFYSMYVWNENEWAMRSFILEFQPIRGQKHVRFEFDHRENPQGSFQKIRGFCQEVK